MDKFLATLEKAAAAMEQKPIYKNGAADEKGVAELKAIREKGFAELNANRERELAELESTAATARAITWMLLGLLLAFIHVYPQRALAMLRACFGPLPAQP